MATKRTKKITAITPEAPSAESSLYDVTLQETSDDGSVQETHQTMTEQEIIAETKAEQVQEVVQEVSVPNAATIQAINDLENGNSQRFATGEELMADLNAEDEPAKEVVAVAEKVSPYQEGYAAYLLGAWYGSNTYVGLSEESFEWQRGWNTAYDEGNKPK